MMKGAMKIKEQTDRQREDNNAIINEIKMQKKLLENKEIKWEKTWIKKAGLTKRSKSTSPDGKIENRKPNGEKV